MMNNWEKLTTEVELETRGYFRDKNYNVAELMDALHKLISARIDDKYKLGGIAVELPKAMFDILDDNTTKRERILNFTVLCKFEPFLRKMLYFLNYGAFCEITNEKKGLSALINTLNLNPNNANLYSERDHLSKSYSDYEYHLYNVYNLRNLESHEMELWGSRELAENIESLFIVYLESIRLHQNEIENTLLNQDKGFSEYIDSLIVEFENNSKKFVYTETIEDFTVFETYAIENSNTLQVEEERSGSVDYIRKNALPEKRMMLWGDAGMGKSTTLQFLTYLDAKEYKAGKTNVIPVYVPLGMLIDENESLEQYICKAMDVEYLLGIDMLKKGRVSLFLDGVNEIPADKSRNIHTRRLKEIQHILDAYPKTFIIISNRPDNYNYFQEIPVFRLQKMDYDKIHEFLDKNAAPLIRDKIIAGINNNTRLLQLIGTPLMTTRLIEIVRDLKVLPQSEGAIIKLFLESLYKRERFEKKDVRFDELKINYLLTDLARYGFDKNGTNSGLTSFEVMDCFANSMTKYHFEYDSAYAFDILIKLGVLSSSKDKDVVVFSHQAYQDYYLSRSGIIVKNQAISKHASKQVDGSDNDNTLLYKKDRTGDVEGTVLGSEHVSASNNVHIDNSTESYFEEYANDERHEKSIIYRLHNSDAEERNKELMQLTKYNLLLAAKAIISGEPNGEIEEYIVNQALKDLTEGKDEGRKLNSVLALIELGRTDKLGQHIHILLKDSRIMRKIIMQLDQQQLLVFFYVLSCQKDINDKGPVCTIIDICKIKEYEYYWDKDNIHRMLSITSFMNEKFMGSPHNLLTFYLLFHVPKDYVINNIESITKTEALKHIQVAKNIVKEYELPVDLSYDGMIDIMAESNLKSAKAKLLVALDKMPVEQRYAYLIPLLGDKYIRKQIYLRLSDEDQFFMTQMYDVYYWKGKSDRRINNLVLLSEEEANKLLFGDPVPGESNLHMFYEKDSKKIGSGLRFSDYLLREYNYKRTTPRWEVLSNASLEDFHNYKLFVEETIGMNKKMQKRSKVNNSDNLSIKLEGIRLSRRTYNALIEAGYEYLEELRGMSMTELGKIRSLKKKHIEEIIKVCKKYGIETGIED